MEWLDGGVVHAKNHWQKWWSSACQIKMLLGSGLSGCLGSQNYSSGRVGQKGLRLGFDPTQRQGKQID